MSLLCTTVCLLLPKYCDHPCFELPFEVWFLFSESVETLERHTAASEDSESNGRIRCRAQLRASFVVLVKKLWCGQFSSLHPKAFKLMLGLVHPPFTGSRQVV